MSRLWWYQPPESDRIPVRQQSAALCYRLRAGAPEVLLITTRKSGRWIIPKGGLIKGMSSFEAAQQEAWEEAGVRGVCSAEIIGRYAHIKQRRKKEAVLCLVEVFPLMVMSLSERYPECDDRERAWFSVQEAAAQVDQPELAQMLRQVPTQSH